MSKGIGQARERVALEEGRAPALYLAQATGLIRTAQDRGVRAEKSREAACFEVQGEMGAEWYFHSCAERCRKIGSVDSGGRVGGQARCAYGRNEVRLESWRVGQGYASADVQVLHGYVRWRQGRPVEGRGLAAVEEFVLRRPIGRYVEGESV